MEVVHRPSLNMTWPVTLCLKVAHTQRRVNLQQETEEISTGMGQDLGGA